MDESVNFDALRRLPVTERIPELIRLENEYPDNPAVKLELGLAYGSAGQYAIAEEYFRRALEQSDRDAELQARAALGLANAHLGQGEFADAIRVAAAYQTGSEASSLKLVEARAQFLAQNSDEARALYAQVWDHVTEQLIASDYLQYADSLIRSDEFGHARDVLSAALERYGYASGIGFRLSTVAEAGGDSSASILYAFLDSLHAVEVGTLDREQLLSNLGRIREQTGGDGAPRDALEFAVAVAAESWGEADALAEGVSMPVGAEVLSAIATANADPSDELIREELVGFVDRFGNYAPLYQALIRSFREDPEYRFATARTVLERAVSLAPQGPVGVAARAELGRLLGLPASDVANLLTDQELVVRAQAAAAGSALEPTVGAILTSLALPEHPYTSTALSLVRDLVRLDRVLEYVVRWIERGPEAARRRVTPLL